MKKIKATNLPAALLIAVTFVLLMSAAQLTAAPDSSPSFEDLAKVAGCVGLDCNDPTDCGSFCFCHNPTDTIGDCHLDEPALRALLRGDG